jgi:hypothetical protein
MQPDGRSFVTRTTAQSHSQAAVFVFILFGVGIARSWELLGLRGGGLLDLLVSGVDKAASAHASGKDADKPTAASD